jgi:hypothetical protein
MIIIIEKFIYPNRYRVYWGAKEWSTPKKPNPKRNGLNSYKK